MGAPYTLPCLALPCLALPCLTLPCLALPIAGEAAEKQVSALNEELTSLKLTVAELEKERSQCLLLCSWK